MLARQSTLFVIVTALAAVQQATAFRISLYQGRGCRSGSAGSVANAKPSDGCLTDGACMAQSAVVVNTGEEDDNYSITFFDSDDCNPMTELWSRVNIMSGDTEGNDDIVNSECNSGLDENREPSGATFRSFQVWDLRNTDAEEGS